MTGGWITERRSFWVASAAGLWALALWATGGIHVEPFGVRISSTDPRRPLIVATTLLAFYAWRWPQAFRSRVCLAGERLLARPGVLVAAVSLTVLVSAMWYGSTAAGAADPYGYLSEALLWRRGQLVVPIGAMAHAPWPEPLWTFAPLGYRPSPIRADAIVPTYAPGLPLIIAAAQVFAGFGAAFAIAPLSAAALVWLTYRLGRDVFEDAGVAVWASVLVAASPTLLFQAMWPMTDVPVAAAWTAALVLAVRRRSLAAGLLVSATLAIRPNLVLLPAALALFVLVRDRSASSWRERLTPAMWLAIGSLPAVVGVAWLNAHLYGSALASGYGNAAGMFAFDRGATNAGRYASWLTATQTPAVFLAVVFFAMPRWGSRPRLAWPRLLLGGTIAAVSCSYLFYEVFDDWWYLRFLLPMWPAMMLAMAAGTDGLFRRFVPWLRPFLLGACVVALLVLGVRTSFARNVFGIGRGERRYVDVARFVEARTEPGAVLIAMQHSGSLRLYAGRLTLRYDWLPDGGLDAAVDYLKSIGRHPYLVIEKWELDQFRRKHGTARLGRLDWPPTGRLDGWNDVAVWDLADTTRTDPPQPIPTTQIDRATGWPAPRPHPAAGSIR